MGILTNTTHRVRKKSTIDIKGNKIVPDNIERVVSYGCSFTHGDEIVDHELLNLSLAEVNKLKQKFSGQAEFYEAHNILLPHPQMQEAAWAGQLAKLINKPFSSYATPGSSLAYHVFQIINDYYVNHTINDKDLILVGLTGIDRIMYFDDRINTLHSCPLPQYIDECGYKYSTARPLIRLFDENFLVTSYFTTLLSLFSLSNILNIRIQPMTESNTLGENFQYRNLVLPEVMDFAYGVWKTVEPILLVKDSYLRVFKENTSTFCGYGHPNIERHTKLAESIYQKCVYREEIISE